MVPWKTTFLYEQGIFHFHVSESECLLSFNMFQPQELESLFEFGLKNDEKLGLVYSLAQMFRTHPIF